jgi:hypothetical protein
MRHAKYDWVKRVAALRPSGVLLPAHQRHFTLASFGTVHSGAPADAPRQLLSSDATRPGLLSKRKRLQPRHSDPFEYHEQ